MNDEPDLTRSRPADPPALRPARAQDLDEIQRVVKDAYGPYVLALDGLVPGPMRADYADLIARGRITVTRTQPLDGLLVLDLGVGDAVVENIAVDPRAQGQGIGSALLDHAEARARAAGHDWLRLFTHERMTANIALYRRRGYLETGREPIGAAGHLVHLRKHL